MNKKSLKISAESAHKKMKEDPACVILDVRSAREFATGKIPGAVLLPLGELHETSCAKIIPNKNTTILVYCRSGIRSFEAVSNLVSMGYVNAYDMGGILDWPYERD